jgi:hypothetical protein
VVNDFGGDAHGTGGSSAPAERALRIARPVVKRSRTASVNNPGAGANMVRARLRGRVDILVNTQALRDASFQVELTLLHVIDVHLLGSIRTGPPCCRQLPISTSTSGIYGNFGQAN